MLATPGLGGPRLDDIERSQSFYETKVGLTLEPETVKNHLLGCGGRLDPVGLDAVVGQTRPTNPGPIWSTDVEK